MAAISLSFRRSEKLGMAPFPSRTCAIISSRVYFSLAMPSPIGGPTAPEPSLAWQFTHCATYRASACSAVNSVMGSGRAGSSCPHAARANTPSARAAQKNVFADGQCVFGINATLMSERRLFRLCCIHSGGCSSVGRASPCQGESRRFESGHPLC